MKIHVAIPSALSMTLLLSACSSSGEPSARDIREPIEKEMIRQMYLSAGESADPDFSPKVSDVELGGCEHEGGQYRCRVKFTFKAMLRQGGEARDIGTSVDGRIRLARIRGEWVVLYLNT